MNMHKILLQRLAAYIPVDGTDFNLFVRENMADLRALLGSDLLDSFEAGECQAHEVVHRLL